MDELEYEQRLKGVWCISARVAAKPALPDERRLGIDTFEPGTKVFCFPPTRPDADPEMKVVGPRKRSGKLATAMVFARHLTDWKADYALDRALIEILSPPWDEDFESHDVADQICHWREGVGDWPTTLLREWNRTRVQKTVGTGPWYKRAATVMKTLFVPANAPVKLPKRRRED